MKAITCTQCGALIRRISLRDKFAVCDYCGAKILLADNREKIVEIPDKKEKEEPELTPYEKYLKKRAENERKYAVMNPPVYQPAEDQSATVKLMLGFLVLFLPIVFYLASGRSCLDRPLDSSKKTLATSSTPVWTPTPFTINEPTFYPQINYSVSVKWTGSNDMEHFESPAIDRTKLPTSDIKQLKKTVFANRSVQVRVTIDENGEVTEAKAISGHPILREAAENAARKTLFANRTKPASRVLTYIFRLTEE